MERPAAATGGGGDTHRAGKDARSGDTDGLTGLLRREAVLEALTRMLTERRVTGGEVAVLLCDIDRFALINDSLGHAAGDVVLQAVARRLETAGRGYAPTRVVGRVAGDEFVMVCSGLSGPAAAREVARQIHQEIERPVSVDGDRLRVRVSIGIAMASEDRAHAEELLQHARSATTRAKDEGRDRIEAYDRGMHEREQDKLRTELDLAGAVDRGELILHYQPILHLGQGRVTGVETLVRWQHPDRGLLAPAEFIPIAEHNGMIRQIDRWVMERAWQQSSAWYRAGITDVNVGVNVSARQLAQVDFVDHVAEVLDRIGRDTVRPHIEITESALMADPDSGARTLDRLRGMGVRLSLDDFGTGYSSLAYLRRFPVDVLKIDRSFAADVDTDPASRALYSAIVDMGQALGLLVLAEGVETASEFDVLKRIGVDLMQGYYLARPVPPDELPLPGFL